ncbi:hypothetical protein [Agrococcus sp. Marseille-Q4369]|uniref:hypothetical protein n=1 Tax=Agrococcus sp. Marseille-Q4369 TaxID=2810513 RepID=UPI001B8B71F3|nr:hypothetical protein [Agrococcus sp. Marseille-Q4369]QUW18272.1 hypothetical protein JSQ78_10615 [Agrococcus sp. Marseille-Q4369]
MSIVAPLPRTARRRNAVLAIALLLPLPLVVALRSILLPELPPITPASACPARMAAGCGPDTVERVRAAIDVLTLGALVAIASLTALLVLLLVAQGRRAWPTAILGLALATASIIGGIELAMIDADR